MENTVRLNNGVEMPRIGYGVYQIPSTITEQCVRDALSVGYRSFISRTAMMIAPCGFAINAAYHIKNR